MSESDSQSIKEVYFHGRQKLGIGEYWRLKHFTNQMPVGLPEDTAHCLRFSRAVNEVLRIKKAGNFTPEEEIHALERIIIGGESITECAKCIGANEKNLQKHIKVIRHNYGGAIYVKALREIDINQAELSAFITELILGKKGRGRHFNKCANVSNSIAIKDAKLNVDVLKGAFKYFLGIKSKVTDADGKLVALSAACKADVLKAVVEHIEAKKMVVVDEPQLDLPTGGAVVPTNNSSY